jgi:hypothetical protein
LKATRYGRLLAKPVVKEVLWRQGGGFVTPQVLSAAWPTQSECYVLTLDTWAGDGGRWPAWHYDQISRRGANLVPQLNFSRKHDRAYKRLIRPTQRDPFVAWWHPVCEDGRHTLAWSRIDLELDSGEALIEEIQSDWVKLAVRKREALTAIAADGAEQARWARRAAKDLECSPQELCRYLDRVLRCHMQMWSEAMLAATIWFLREELGLRTIFYHTHATGARLTGIRYDHPPKSLYSTLPRQFLFEETSQVPVLLRRSKNKRVRRLLGKSPRFFRLSL